METLPFIEYRCTCGRLLFKGAMLRTRLQIKCKRCGVLVPFGPEASDDGVARYGILVDANFNIKGVSDTASGILGYSREELLSMNGSQLSPYWSGASMEGQWQKLSALAELPIAFDQAQVTKSGTVLEVRARVSRSVLPGDGCALYLFEVLGAKGPAALRDEFPLGVRRIDLIAELDLSGRYAYASKELGEFLGREPLHLLGASVFSAFREEDRAPHLRCFMEMARTRSAYAIPEAHLEDGKGGARTARLSFFPLYRDDGAIRGYSLLVEP